MAAGGFSVVSLGVLLGLVPGKPLGVVVGAWLAVRLGVASLPRRVTWSHIVGAGLLAGIGFTVSLSVSNLAFADEELLTQAKLGVLAASLLAAALGSAWLLLVAPAPGRAGKPGKASPERPAGADTPG